MLKKYSNLLARIKFIALILFFQAIIGGANITAQNPYSSTPERGLSNGKAYDVNNIERIGFQDGSVNLTIPLASLPPVAGGKLGYTLNAYYNSKPWKSYSQQTTLSYPRLTRIKNDQSTPWRIGGAYGVAIERVGTDEFEEPSNACDAFISYTPPGSPYIDYEWCARERTFDYRFYVYTPDGGKHELRTFDYSTYSPAGHMLYRQAAYKDTPTSVNSPIRYYTFDGSYMWVQINPTTSWWDTNNWTILMKDGTKVVNTPDGIQRIFDTNGNSIKIYTEYVNNQGITHYQDELTGREIKVMTDPADSNGHLVAYKKVGGDWEFIKIKWENNTVTGLYVPDNSPCLMPALIEASFPIVREIQFPSTESGVAGRKFSFEFNSDTSINTNGNYYVLDFPSNCQTTHFPQNQVSAGWGELSKVTFPSGAVTEYEYSANTLGTTQASDVRTNRIISKKFSHDGTQDIWTYYGDIYFAQVTNPNSSIDKYYFIGGLSGSSDFFKYTGLTYKEEHGGKIRIERRWKNLRFDGTIPDAKDLYFQKYNSVVEAEYTTLLENENPVKTSAKNFQYDYNGNVKQTTEYDWFDPALLNRDVYGPTGIPAGINALRTTTADYHNPADTSNSTNIYAKQGINGSPRFLNALKQTSTYGIDENGAQYLAAKTQFSYDGQAYDIAPTNGNLTQISAWNDTNGQFINSYTGYDSYGNVNSKTDPNNKTTQISYDAATHATPTQIIVDPQNGTGVQTATTAYDFSTGLPTSTTDINGNVSSVSYNNHLLGAVDPFGRPGTVYSPYVNVNSVNKRQTVKTYYEDAARITRAESDLFEEGDGRLKSKETRDQLGRTILSERNENGVAAYTISSQTIYKTLPNLKQNVVMSSNPRRAGAAISTDGWTRVTSDVLGRTIEATTFSGTNEPPLTGTLYANPTGTLTTVYSANQTTVTDQAGKKRRSVVNALGQLERVDEPKKDTGELDVNGNPYQSTSYAYDVLGNLRKVEQGVQRRYFLYDSLSRLIRVRNPELRTHPSLNLPSDALSDNNSEWSIGYVYDKNGNLKTKVDARANKTIYEYDGLNRLVKRCYKQNDGVLDTIDCDASTDLNEVNRSATYTYDNLQFAKGRLTKVATGNPQNPFSVTEYQVFDALGRITQSQQKTDGTVPNSMTYKYNLSGALTEETYPSGRVVKNTFDNGGDLSAVQSKKNASSNFYNYAKGFTYIAAGAVSSMQLGNGNWETTRFNSRLQPTQIALGMTQNQTNLLKLEYTYNTLPNVADNNGNVKTQKITVPAVNTIVSGDETTISGFTATQTYNYDSLNRIKDATETIGTTEKWKQTFEYDRFGNRTFNEAHTTTLPKSCGTSPNFTVCPADNPSPNAADNRLNGVVYDEAGNTTTDGRNWTFIYDAENKQTQANNLSGPVGKYFYDGDGRRVKKEALEQGVWVTTIFVYDATGKLVAEYSTKVATASEAKVSYLTNDHLGSPRIITHQNGNVTSRRDFLPFGEEIAANIGGRSNVQGYGDDNIRKKFTGQQRDTESDLDYFNARYYAPFHGRFTSVDPENVGASEGDPQSWNGYAYARNNPQLLVDPDGEKYVYCDMQGQCANYDDDDFHKRIKNLPDGYTRVKGKDGSGSVYFNGQLVATYTRPSVDFGSDFATGAMNETARRAPAAGNLALVTAGAGMATGAAIGCVASGPLCVGAAVTTAKTALGRQAIQSAVGLTTKAAAREEIGRMAVSEAAKAAARSAVSRATTKSTIDVVREGSTLIVRVLRPGRNGHQVIESVIKSDGTKTVVQKAFDAAGNLVHYHPK
jgi:RHS repeat-associated protein